jgi:hypothetical protein
MRMSVPARMEFPCAAAIGRRRRCAAQCPNPRRRSQRLPSTAVTHAGLHASLCGGPAPAWGRVAARLARGGVCQILVLVNRLKKEHSV